MSRSGASIFVVLILIFLAGCNRGTQTESTVLTGAPTFTSVSPNSAAQSERNVKVLILGTNLTTNATVDMGAGIQVEEITFGNGTSLLVTFSVSRSSATGPRVITVTTPQGSASSSSLFSIRRNQHPVAVFSVIPSAGNIDTIFTFDASQSSDLDGHIAAYEWQFRDGTSGEGPVVRHLFLQPDSYRVRLVVTDNAGLRMDVIQGITVTDRPAPPPPIPPPSGSNCPPPAELIGSSCCYQNKCCSGESLEKGSIGWCSGRLMCTAGASGFQPPLPGFETFPGQSCSTFPD